MAELSDRIQTADWKREKHVPVIECPDEAPAGVPFDVKISVGKEIAHPNTTEHHIAWISLYFNPEGDKFSYDVGRFDFNAHGQSVAGPNQGPAHTDPTVTASVKIGVSGTLHALSYCNIHGLWESSKEIKVA